jgi:hypothetical protein
MLFSSNPQPKRDIFKELQERRQQSAAQKSERMTQKEQEKLMSMSNDKTHADEAAIVITGILYLVVAFLTYLSYHYYLKIFSETFDPIAAVIFAIGLPIAVEVATVYLGQKVLKAIFFNWYRESGAHLGYWLINGLICAGFFLWSFHISTRGITELARDNATAKNKPAALNEQIKAATLDIDAQIAAITANNGDAGSMKTRSGKINYSGRAIIQNNSATLSSLQEQRKSITEQTIKTYNTDTVDVSVKVNGWVNFIQRFGGFGELIKFFLMLAIAFFQKMLFEINVADASETAAKLNKSPLDATEMKPPVNGSKIYNSAPIGFNRPNMNAHGNIIPLHERQNTVSQSQATVSQQPQSMAVIGSDEVLKNLRTVIQREMPGFSNHQAKPESVHRRITEALDKVYDMMCAPGFTPSRTVSIDVWKYLHEAFTLLNQRGWPYDKSIRFLDRLQSTIEQTAKETA